MKHLKKAVALILTAMVFSLFPGMGFQSSEAQANTMQVDTTVNEPRSISGLGLIEASEYVGVKAEVELPATNIANTSIIKTLKNERAEYEFSMWVRGSGEVALGITGYNGVEYVTEKVQLESDEWVKLYAKFETHSVLDGKVTAGLEISKYGDANPTYFYAPSLKKIGEEYEYLTPEEMLFDNWNLDSWHSGDGFQYKYTPLTADELLVLEPCLPLPEVEPAPPAPIDPGDDDVGPFESVITLDTSTKYQTIDGFGTFIDPQTPGFTSDDSPRELYNMNPDKRNELLDLLYDRDKGAGFNILRMEAINGYYYGAKEYTILPDVFPVLPLDQRPDWQKDPNIFPKDYYQWDGSGNGYVEICKEVVKRGADTLFLNAWSAPAYMKTNNSPTGDAGGGGSLIEGWEAAYADYLVQYIRSFASSGVNITHVAPYNEPEVPSWYQGMIATPEQLKATVKALGQALEKSKFKDVKIVASESGNMKGDDPTKGTEAYIKPILNDPETAKYLGIASGHGYMDPLFAVRMPQSAIDNGINVWMSEFSPIDFADPVFNPKYTGHLGGAYTSNNVMHTLNEGVSAYIDWSAIANKNNSLPNQHLILLDSKSEYRVAKRLWAIANYSRFIRPGAVRFKAESDASKILVTAFENTDGSYAVVLINNSSEAYDVQIGDIDSDKATPYVTDDDHALEQMADVKVVDSKLDVEVPGNSTVTYVFSTVIPKIIITGVNKGNGQADVNFAIRSANGKGYSVYISESGVKGTYTLYNDVNYNSKGAHIKGLTNGKTYYVYIVYSSGDIYETSGIAILEPSK